MKVSLADWGGSLFRLTAMLSHKPWSGHAVFRLFLGVFSTYCFGNIIVGLLYRFKLGMSRRPQARVGVDRFFNISAGCLSGLDRGVLA